MAQGHPGLHMEAQPQNKKCVCCRGEGCFRKLTPFPSPGREGVRRTQGGDRDSGKGLSLVSGARP